MRASHRYRLPIGASLLLLAAACGKKEEVPEVAPPPPAAVVAFRVTDVDLGNSLNADMSIGNKTGEFKPGDTVYVSVASEGASPGAAIKATWTFQDGQLVDTTTRMIVPAGPTRTEFHVSKPSGWPVGKYKVEIMVDGALAGSKEFEVKRS